MSGYRGHKQDPSRMNTTQLSVQHSSNPRNTTHIVRVQPSQYSRRRRHAHAMVCVSVCAAHLCTGARGLLHRWACHLVGPSLRRVPALRGAHAADCWQRARCQPPPHARGAEWTGRRSRGQRERVARHARGCIRSQPGGLRLQPGCLRLQPGCVRLQPGCMWLQVRRRKMLAGRGRGGGVAEA